MIILKEWLQEFLDVSALSAAQIAARLNAIGHEVAAQKKYDVDKNVVVGFVKSKQAHPDADKLSVCLVDVGNETLQIVCGAKNVAAGQFVAVSLVGAVLPGGLEIKPAKLRGVESNGMICSSAELGLPKLNDGILELDESIGKLVLGKELRSYGALFDEMIEVELTPNRGDCLSIYGMARELGAALGLALKARDLSVQEKHSSSMGIGRVLALKTSNDITSKNLFTLMTASCFGVSLKHRLRLALSGQEYSNAIDGLIKYASLATGVVFDVFATNATQKVQLALKKEDGIDVCYANDKILAQNGIRSYSAFNENSREIVVKASYEDPRKLCSAVHSKRLKTSPYYYNTSRGSEPDLLLGINYVQKEAAASSDGFYLYNENIGNDYRAGQRSVELCIDEISKIIGEDIGQNKITEILRALGFEVLALPEQNFLRVNIPEFRSDVATAWDLAEEVLRMRGIDNLPEKPLDLVEIRNADAAYAAYKLQRSIARKAQARGASECVTFAFADRARLIKYGFATVNEASDLLNPITSELNTLRTTLALGLLDVCRLNLNKQKESVLLFEFGDVFTASGENEKRLAVLSCSKDEDFASFTAKLLGIIGDFDLVENKTPRAIEQAGQSAKIMIAGKEVGGAYKLSPQVRADLELPPVFLCEVDLKALAPKAFKAAPHSKYQAVKRDLSLVVADEIAYSEIKAFLQAQNVKYLTSFSPVATYKDASLKASKSLTVRLVLQSFDGTLEEEEINASVNRVVELLRAEFKAELR
ncbi:MAG: phenylalanine--tRNA ligase subunit beta [Helicobacteraceae bacterium]